MALGEFVRLWQEGEVQESNEIGVAWVVGVGVVASSRPESIQDRLARPHPKPCPPITKNNSGCPQKFRHLGDTDMDNKYNRAVVF